MNACESGHYRHRNGWLPRSYYRAGHPPHPFKWSNVHGQGTKKVYVDVWQNIGSAVGLGLLRQSMGNYVQTSRDSNNCTNFQVAWLRATDQTVLALQDLVVSHNNRISISHEGMHTFRLRIKQIRESDKGCYMCQINSSPMKKEIGCIDVQGKHF